MDGLREKYIAAIAAAQDESALEETRLAAVGKKGEVSLKLRELGKMTPEERQVAGPALNALKEELNSALTARKAASARSAPRYDPSDFAGNRRSHGDFCRYGFWRG